MKMPEIKATHLRKFHAIATFVWFILVFPSVFLWKESIMWVVLMSVWANLASHFSAWQAARGEVETKKNNND